MNSYIALISISAAHYRIRNAHYLQRIAGRLLAPDVLVPGPEGDLGHVCCVARFQWQRRRVAGSAQESRGGDEQAE